MPLLLMKLVFASLGKPCALWRSLAGFAAGQGIQKTWLDPQLATHARFIDDHLAARPWFAGERLSMADIQMSFPVMALLARGGMHDLVHIEARRQRVEQRPAGNAPSSAAAPSPYPAPEISADPMTSINESNSLKIVSGLRMDDNVCASSGYFLFVISEI